MHLLPPEINQFSHPEPVPVGHQEERRVSVSIPDGRLGGIDQSIDFLLCELFPAPDVLALRTPQTEPGFDCP
jgi:hypothetical protein